MGQCSKVLLLLIMHTQYHRGSWTVDQALKVPNVCPQVQCIRLEKTQFTRRLKRAAKSRMGHTTKGERVHKQLTLSQGIP